MGHPGICYPSEKKWVLRFAQDDKSVTEQIGSSAAIEDFGDVYA